MVIIPVFIREKAKIQKIWFLYKCWLYSIRTIIGTLKLNDHISSSITSCLICDLYTEMVAFSYKYPFTYK